MADKETDSPKRKGLKRITSAITEKDAEGKSYSKMMRDGFIALGLPSGGAVSLFALVVGMVPLTQVGEYEPFFLDEAAGDQSLSVSFDQEAGLNGENSYQAISSDGQQIMLVNDAGDWRVYEALKHGDGDLELVLIEDQFEAYAALMGTISDVEDAVDAFQSFEIGASFDAPRFVEYGEISMPYAYEGTIRRAVDDDAFVFQAGESLMPAYTAMQETWNIAAQDILDQGFTEKTLPENVERPEVEFPYAMKVLGASLLVGVGFGVAGGAIGAGAASAGLAARRRRLKRLNNG